MVHASGHRGAKKGRGAGGHCFPKDLAALRRHAHTSLGRDHRATQLLRALESANLDLLLGTSKDRDLLEGIYGTSALDRAVGKRPRKAM